MKFDCARCGKELDVTAVTCDECVEPSDADRACRVLVEAFRDCGPTMESMDASDFKDRAAATWRAVQLARIACGGE